MIDSKLEDNFKEDINNDLMGNSWRAKKSFLFALGGSTPHFEVFLEQIVFDQIMTSPPNFSIDRDIPASPSTPRLAGGSEERGGGGKGREGNDGSGREGVREEGKQVEAEKFVGSCGTGCSSSTNDGGFDVHFISSGNERTRRTASALIGALGESSSSSSDNGNSNRRTITKDIVDVYNRQLSGMSQPLPLYVFPIPKLMVLLAVRTLLYGGLHAEGVFRKGVDQQQLQPLILEINEGRVDSLPVADCHTYAMLLRTWLRAMRDRLIPSAKHALAIDFVTKVSEEEKENEKEKEKYTTPTYSNRDLFAYYNCCSENASVSPVTSFINKHLNPAHNLSLKYLVRFLRIFTIEPYVKSNRMDLNNIAIVMSPNILHLKTTGSEPKNITDVFATTQLEIKFASHLIRTLCITAGEESLFEYLDASTRKEKTTNTTNKGEDSSGGSNNLRPVLGYYVWE